MTKTTRKHSKTTTEADETALAMVQRILGTGLGAMDTYVTRTAEIVGESSDPEAASLFAHTLTKVALIAAELRKAEAAERKAAEGLSKGELFEAARRMPAPEREAFAREVLALNTKRSGLA